MLEMIDPVKAQEVRESLPKFNVIKASGPGFLTPLLVEYLQTDFDNSMLILPKHFFYPVSNQERKSITADSYEQLIP